MGRIALPIGLLLALTCAVAAQTSVSVWDGVYTDEQAARGKSAYADHCAACHADDLSGGMAAGDPAPALKMDNFGVSWRNLANLYNFLRDQMPADRPASLPRTMYADILAFLLEQNSYPAGSQELQIDLEALERIRVVTKLPDLGTAR